VKSIQRYTVLLLLLNILLMSLGYFLINITKISLLYIDVIILSSLFSVIALTTIIIFLTGQSKEPDSQTLHSLVSITLKFLLELVLALVWFIVAKKISLLSVVLFFVLYLTFTLFSIWVILKTLRNKSL
jgi:hypothetical protein